MALSNREFNGKELLGKMEWALSIQRISPNRAEKCQKIRYKANFTPNRYRAAVCEYILVLVGENSPTELNGSIASRANSVKSPSEISVVSRFATA